MKIEASDIRFEDMSKKRQEIADQLKQISNKIDQSIYQLRKQNDSSEVNSSYFATPKSKEQRNILEKSTRIKTETVNNNAITFSFHPSTPSRQPSKHKPSFSDIKVYPSSTLEK